jgi:hypothetical protein
MKTTQDGATLIEVLIAGGIIGSVALATSGSLTIAYRNLNQQYFNMGRDRLALAITQAAGAPTAIRNSMIQNAPGVTIDPDNQTLFNCAYWGYCDGTGAQTGIYTPMRLYEPYYTATSTMVTQGGPMAGTAGPTGIPIQYDPDGNPCDPRTTTCSPNVYPIAVVAEFMAMCPPVYDAFYDATARNFDPSTGAQWLNTAPQTVPPSDPPPSNNDQGDGTPFPGPLGLPSVSPYLPSMVFPASAVYPWGLAQPDYCPVVADFKIRLTFTSLTTTAGIYLGYSFPQFTTTAIAPGPPSSGTSGGGLFY